MSTPSYDQAVRSWSLVKLSSDQQEALKWLAIITMALDHVAVILLPTDTFLYILLRTIGRLAFPLFALLIAYNIVRRGVKPPRYYAPLGIFALISQVPYLWALGVPRGNIFFTLLFGVLVLDLLLGLIERVELLSWLALLPYVIVALLLSPLYGLWGVLLIPLFGLALRYGGVVWLAPLACTFFMNWPSAVTVFAPLLFVVAALSVQQIPINVSRGNKWVFYVFYPGHLALLALLAMVM